MAMEQLRSKIGRVSGQAIVLALILVLAAWRVTSPSATDEVDEGLKSNISAAGDWIRNLPVIGGVIEATQITDQIWCPYANPYLSRFFASGGSLDFASGDPMFGEIVSILSFSEAEAETIRLIRLETTEDGGREPPCALPDLESHGDIATKRGDDLCNPVPAVVIDNDDLRPEPRFPDRASYALDEFRNVRCLAVGRHDDREVGGRSWRG